METREDIWNEFFAPKWTAEDGLTRLLPKGEEVPMMNQLSQETARNDNGILFLAYFIFTAHACGMKNEIRSKFKFLHQTIEALVRLPHRGLFNRRAAGDMKPTAAERHDNYIAISGISALMGFSYTNEIISYGSLHAWNYNNIEPDKWDVEAQRQGGDIAYYWICMGVNPAILDFIWLCGGLIANIFSKDHGKSMLAWMRLYVLFHVKPHAWWVGWPLIIIAEVWKFAKESQFATLQDLFGGYFRHDHPTYRMAGTLKGWGF